MQRKDFFVGPFLLLLTLPLGLSAQSRVDFSAGLQAGLARLESDIQRPELSPFVSGGFRVIPTPFFSLGMEVGFSELKDRDRSNFKSTIIPFELDGRVSFLPFSSVTPFAFVGGGGVYWSASQNGQVIVINGSKQQGIDSFLKTGGGLDFALNNRVSLQVGAAFRYSLTDALDQRFSGDEKDQVLSTFVGLSYHFRSSRYDHDRDGVPDDLDLAVDVPEDPDGFLDHDGVPEEGPGAQLALIQSDQGAGRDELAPVVIHHPKHEAEAGHSLKLKVEIFPPEPLSKASVVYRSSGDSTWSVSELRSEGGRRFLGVVPASDVTTPSLEYAIVALGKDVQLVGFSGLPKRPNRVRVFGNGRLWRYIGGVIGTLGWGSASYLVLRNQQ